MNSDNHYVRDYLGNRITTLDQALDHIQNLEEKLRDLKKTVGPKVDESEMAFD